MFIAFRGFSVILFAPICALFAVLLTEPSYVMPFYTGIFMDKMVIFIKSYFPVLLGAIFGKVMEMSGFWQSITNTVIKVIGTSRAMLAIVLVGAVLTYGGVSVFVVVITAVGTASYRRGPLRMTESDRQTTYDSDNVRHYVGGLSNDTRAAATSLWSTGYDMFSDYLPFCTVAGNEDGSVLQLEDRPITMCGRSFPGRRTTRF